MKTLEYLSANLGSPIVSDRDRALLCLINEAMENPNAIKQLGLNLKSDNFDIIWFSLKALLAISFRDTSKLKTIKSLVVNLGKNSSHFAIVNLCKNILEKLDNRSYSTKGVFKKLIPPIIDSTGMPNFYDNCDHSFKYAFENEHYSYVLSYICRAFRYDCKKASKRLFSYMKSLGYRKGKRYWKDMPDGWRNYYLGDRYETLLAYFARHGLQMLLMWCTQNLTAYSEDWGELLIYERDFDPATPMQLFKEKPDFIQFNDLNVETDTWLKKKITIKETYKLLNRTANWIPLYENTKFKSDNKSYGKYVTTCFIRKPVGKLPQKREIATVYYECKSCLINEVPCTAKKNKWLYVINDNHSNKLDSKLIPSYGIISEDFDDYKKLFPVPEIVEYFNLKQKPNTLKFYKGKELVINCINWRSGFHRNIGAGREDKFELANYGQVLLIKTKYLRKYLNESNLNLIAVANVNKQKISSSSQEYDYSGKNSKHKWLPFEIVKLKICR